MPIKTEAKCVAFTIHSSSAPTDTLDAYIQIDNQWYLFPPNQPPQKKSLKEVNVAVATFNTVPDQCILL